MYMLSGANNFVVIDLEAFGRTATAIWRGPGGVSRALAGYGSFSCTWTQGFGVGRFEPVPRLSGNGECN